jgi:hypothetical protein
VLARVAADLRTVAGWFVTRASYRTRAIVGCEPGFGGDPLPTGSFVRLVRAVRRQGRAVGCRHEHGLLPLGNLGCFTLAASLCWTALVSVLLATAASAAAYHRPAAWNKSAAFKKVGYVELSGEDAVRFLVGNSVLVQKSGPIDGEKDGIETQAKVYYFLNAHSMYECGVTKEPDCYVQSWGLNENRICLDLGVCGPPPKIMRAPSAGKRVNGAGKLGVFLLFDSLVYDIVKGNRSGGPLFDAHLVGRPIQLARSDFKAEIQDASHDSGANKEIPIYGMRAGSLLIGNTFLSDDAAKFAKDPTADACPRQGTYYSPAGRVIHFTCHGSPDATWSISISHWKIQSGRFCTDGPMDIGEFGCNRAIVNAIRAPQESGAGDKMLIQDLESGNPLVGYVGNALNFRFENDPNFGKSKEK